MIREIINFMDEIEKDPQPEDFYRRKKENILNGSLIISINISKNNYSIFSKKNAPTPEIFEDFLDKEIYSRLIRENNNDRIKLSDGKKSLSSSASPFLIKIRSDKLIEKFFIKNIESHLKYFIEQYFSSIKEKKIINEFKNFIINSNVIQDAKETIKDVWKKSDYKKDAQIYFYLTDVGLDLYKKFHTKYLEDVCIRDDGSIYFKTNNDVGKKPFLSHPTAIFGKLKNGENNKKKINSAFNYFTFQLINYDDKTGDFAKLKIIESLSNPDSKKIYEESGILYVNNWEDFYSFNNGINYGELYKSYTNTIFL